MAICCIDNLKVKTLTFNSQTPV